MMSTISDLPSSVKGVLLITFFNRLGGIVRPYIVLYATTQLHLSIEKAGQLMSAYGMGAVIAVMLGGVAVDFWGCKSLLRLSAGGMVLSMMLMFLNQSVGMFVVTVLMLSAFTELFRPAVATIISRHVVGELTAQLFAFQHVIINVAAVIAPLIGACLIVRSYSLLFLFGLAMSIVCFVLVAITIPQVQVEKIPKKEGERVRLSGHFFMIVCANLLFASFCIQFSMILPIYIQSLFTESTWVYSMMLAANAGGVIALAYPVSRFFREWPPLKAIAVGVAFLGIGNFSMALFGKFEGVLVSVGILTLGEVILFVQVQRAVVQSSPKALYGKIFGILQGLFSLGLVVLPTAFGFILKYLNFSQFWIGSAVISLVAALAIGRRSPCRVTTVSCSKIADFC